MAFTYHSANVLVLKKIQKCAVTYLSQRYLSLQLWGKIFTTVEEAFLFKKQTKPNKNPSHPLHTQLICAQLFQPLKHTQSQGYSQVPSHSLLQSRNAQTNSFECCLQTWVWALGGCKATWRISAAWIFHSLHCLRFFFPSWLSKFASQTNTFPSNFCKIFTYYFSISHLSSSKSSLRVLEKLELFHTNHQTKDTSFRTQNITNLTIAATLCKPQIQDAFHKKGNMTLGNETMCH